MPVLAGQQSKFAVLKIDDDSSSSSEDEGKKLVNTAAKGHNESKKKGVKGNNGGLLVHVLTQKPKQKGKKAKKLQSQVIDSEGFIVQDADDDYLERKFREDLREALKNSRESVSNVQPPPTSAQTSKPPIEKTEEVSKKDPTEMLIADLDKQAATLMSKADGPNKAREKQLMTLYRTRLLETFAQLTLQTEAAAKAEADANKYRNRYKRICEVLRDAEVNEKAHMTVELERARKVEAEMGTQIGALQGELMQARTKIRELESRLKEQDTKH